MAIRLGLAARSSAWLWAASMVLVACQGGGDPAGQGPSGQPTKPAASTAAIDTPPPTTRTPSAAPTPPGRVFRHALGPAPTPIRVATGTVKTGAPPRVEYVAALGPRQVVVRPGGTIAATLEVTPVGNEGYRHVSFAPYASGWLTGFDFMGPTATLVSLEGALGDSLGPGPSYVVSSEDRQQVVFTFASGNSLRTQAAVLGPSGVRKLGPAISTAGFLGDHQVVVSTRAGVFRVDTRDLARTPVPGISTATMVSSRAEWLIGDAQEAHGVFDARSGEPILSSPEYELEGFSPSGQLVIGSQQAAGRLLIAVAAVKTGRMLRAFSVRGLSAPLQAVWEDERTFLIGFTRFRLDGTVERPRTLGERPAPGIPPLLPPPTS